MSISDPKFQRELKDIVSVLSGNRPPAFENEKLRAFFQLKFWLNSNDEYDYRSLRCGASLYAGSRIAEIVRHSDTSDLRNRPFMIFRGMLESEEICALFDDWYANQEYFGKNGSPRLSPYYKKKRDIIRSVNHFTHLCLRVELLRKTKVIALAREQYGYDCKEDNRLFRDLDPYRKTLRRRLPFLFVARRKFARVLSLPRDADNLYAELDARANMADYFQRYFSYCAFVQDVLRRGEELNGRLIAGWAGTRARRFKDLTPLSEADVAARYAHEDVG